MEFDPRYLEENLPEGLPPRDAMPGGIFEEIERSAELAKEVDPRLLMRSMLWTAAIFEALRAGDIEVTFFGRPPMDGWRGWFAGPWTLGFTNAPLSIGLLDQKLEAFDYPDVRQPGFGLILTATHAPSFRLPVDPKGIPGSIPLGPVRIPRFAIQLPLVLRLLSEEAHGCPSHHLVNARCASDARSNATGVRGLVVAKHSMVGLSPGNTIPLSPSGSAKLVDTCPSIVDGAFIEYVMPQPPHAAPRPVIQYPAAGLPVRVHAAKRPFHATVVSVTDTLGVLDDELHPIKVYLDKAGAPGDSGALVESYVGAAVAIYSGKLSGARRGGQSGVTVGFAQHMGQVASMMDIEVLG